MPDVFSGSMHTESFPREVIDPIISAKRYISVLLINFLRLSNSMWPEPPAQKRGGIKTPCRTPSSESIVRRLESDRALSCEQLMKRSP
jgi:hypothetical protein